MEKSERCSPEKQPRSEEKILMEGLTMNETTKKAEREALLDLLTKKMLPKLSTERLRHIYFFVRHALKKAGEANDT